jgi:hypothetical protein
MCGGIAAAMSAAPAPDDDTGSRNLRMLAQNLGRITSYATAGAVVGSLGSVLPRLSGLGGASGTLAIRSIAALLMIAAGLQIGGWSSRTGSIERVGSLLWRRIAPLARRVGRASSIASALVFGALWGWLPCGLVYSALVVAAASGSAAAGASTMAAFGLGTVPALLAISGASAQGLAVLRSRSARRAAGAAVIVFGAWTFAAAASGYLAPCGHCHDESSAVPAEHPDVALR